MTIEYVVKREAGALVTFCIVDETDFIELTRLPGACCDDDVAYCAQAIAESQRVAEEWAGGLLPWVVPTDDDDPRACWTTPLVYIQT